LSKINESKNQKVLWNVEQMHFVGCIEKRSNFKKRDPKNYEK